MLEDNARDQGQPIGERYRWDCLIIPEDTLKKLKTLCESLSSVDILQKQGLQSPRNALLYGPPGTLKTQVARTLANESALRFIVGAPLDLKTWYVGRKWPTVRYLFDKARAYAPCILFIDDLDSSAPVRGSQYADQLTAETVTGLLSADEIVIELLSAMDDLQKSSRHVFILAATNYLERIDPAILSRFTYKIEITNPV